MPSVTESHSRSRTQAERSADTRNKVIDAAVASIAEDGFKQATTTRIARRAGVTWGAIQHQFADKEGILRAVMERGMGEFRDGFAESGDTSLPLEQRVSEFTRHGWAYFRRPAFQAFLAIILNVRSEAEAERFKRQSITYLSEFWNKVFGDLDLDPQQHFTAQRFAMAVLTGMAIEVNLVPELSDYSRELAAFNDTLVALLSQASPD